MLSRSFAAFGLMALCVFIHAIAVNSALVWMVRGSRTRKPGFFRGTWRFVRLAGWMIVAHLLEITAWAWFFAWKQAMPDLASALYFSAATYTTVGYGDVVLPVEWRLIGGVEALTGILMAGWSTGFFFAAVSQLIDAQPLFKRAKQP